MICVVCKACLKSGKDWMALMCSGRLFQSLMVLGKKECLWLLTVESGIGKLCLLLLVLRGSTFQTKSSRGSSMDLDLALCRRWSLALALLVSKGGQSRKSRFLLVFPWVIM